MNILAIGTCCVDIYPQKNTVTPGGEALNIAAQLSFAKGVDVYLMAKIGNDVYGDRIVDSIEQLAINAEHLYQVEGETANHVIHIDNDGDRFFETGAWSGGVSTELILDGTAKALLSQMDAVMATLWEPNLSTLLALKHEKNYKVAVDFNEQRDFSDWEHLINNIDVFFISAEESLTKMFYERSKHTDTIFVLTFGENGSIAYSRGKTFHCAAVKLDKVLDTTGCGDCYQGYFMAEYVRSGDINLSMQKASEAAAKVACHVGGFQIADQKLA